MGEVRRTALDYASASGGVVTREKEKKAQSSRKSKKGAIYISVSKVFSQGKTFLFRFSRLQLQIY